MNQGRPLSLEKRAVYASNDSAGVVATACVQEEMWRNTGSLIWWKQRVLPTGNPRGPDRADEVAERSVVPKKPGNAGGGKGP